MKNAIRINAVGLGLAAAVGLVGLLRTAAFARNDTSSPGGGKEVAVTIQGGQDTDPRDRGRPVVLVAAGLGVPDDVFREAFTHVHPAKNGGPTGDEARANKKALMDALAKYGVTNDRLDEVSNYYRYRRQNGETWKHRDAVVVAHVTNGQVTSVAVTDAGAGYSSPPTLTVPGFPDVKLKAMLAFGKDLKSNGKIDQVVRADGPATRP